MGTESKVIFEYLDDDTLRILKDKLSQKHAKQIFLKSSKIVSFLKMRLRKKEPRGSVRKNTVGCFFMLSL